MLDKVMKILIGFPKVPHTSVLPQVCSFLLPYNDSVFEANVTRCILFFQTLNLKGQRLPPFLTKNVNIGHFIC